MAEHLLDAAQVGAALEQVRRKRVAQEVRVDPLRLEARDRREPAQDEKAPGASRPPPFAFRKSSVPVAPVEERAARGR